MATSTLPRQGVLVFRRDDVRVFLFLVSLIGLYMQFHLYAGVRIAFPFLFPNLIGMAAFIHYALKRQFLPALTTVIALVLFTLVAVMIAALDGYFGRALGKYLQLLFSIFAGYGLCTLILKIPRERLRRLLARLAWAILIVAFAEVYLGLYGTMTQINSVLYSWRPDGFYSSVERDIELWGGVRPLVFSTEPSLVGIWGTVLMVGATILSPSDHWKRYLVLIAYVGVLLFIARSTTTILILVAYMGATVFDKRNSLSKQIMLFFGSIGAAWILAFTSALTLMGQYLQGTSFFARITGPYLTTLETLDRSPFFGLGLGNDRLLEVIVFDVWARTGMLVRSAVYIEQVGLDGMLTNNFFWVWINLGVVGGVFLLTVVFGFVRQIGRFPVTMVLLTTFGTWMTVGGFVDIRTWFFLYFFIACAISFERDESNAPTRQT
jgi:hypothetical protein